MSSGVEPAGGTDGSGWDETTDVVVIGSGGGGLCAALTARSHGLDVLVAEKAELVGGSTAMSGGGLWIPNSPVMRAAGAPDSADQALTYLDAVVGDVGPASPPERRRAYVENAPRLVAFLQGLGVPFRFADGYADYYSDEPGGSRRGRTIEAHPYDTRTLGSWAARLRPGMSTGLGLIGFGTELSAMTYYNRHPRNLVVAARVWLRTQIAKLRGRRMVANGAALVGRLLEQALAQGARIWTEAPLRELVVRDGAVVGVVLVRDGRETRVRARHGVLLAAGGFSRNGEMRETYGGTQARSAQWSVANPGDTGEVLQQAMAAGAATELMDEAIWLPMAALPDGRLAAYPSRQTSAFGRARWRPGSIIVDAAGRRFVNEAISTSELAQRMFAHDAEARSVPAWLVFDDAFRRRCLFGAVPGRLPQKWLDDGFVLRAGSLAELAQRCGIDPAGLEETCRRFNGFARDGVDADFHRGETAYDRFMGDPRHGPNNCLAPVERAPFYAVAIYPLDVGTCGGVLTDADARVLSADGTPVPGLFATGNITASVQGRAYVGAGASIGQTCTFGYVAVNTIAAQQAATSSRAS